MTSYIVYYENDGRIAHHNYQESLKKLQRLCRVNPGLTYMEGKCKPEYCRVNVSVDPHVVEHEVFKPSVIALIREKRNKMLKACDWTQGADSPLSDSKKTEWQTYRQSLRDIIDSYGSVSDINDVVWPTPPS